MQKRRLRRVTRTREGFDCRGGCERPTRHENEPGGACRFGCHGDEWWYAVVDAEHGIALSVTMYTDDLRGGHGQLAVQGRELGYPHEYSRPHVAGATGHAAFPTDRESVLKGHGPDACEFLPETGCYWFETEGHALKEVLGAEREQPEEFWRTMEALHEKMARRAEAERADTRWERCSHCDATGLVRRP